MFHQPESSRLLQTSRTSRGFAGGHGGDEIQTVKLPKKNLVQVLNQVAYLSFNFVFSESGRSVSLVSDLYYSLTNLRMGKTDLFFSFS